MTTPACALTASDAAHSLAAERRAHPRHEVPAGPRTWVRVVDAGTQAVIGELDDVSIGGLRLQAPSVAGLGESGERALRLLVCIEGRELDPIDVLACRRWARHETSLGMALAGFEFTHLSMQAVVQLDAVVQMLSA